MRRNLHAGKRQSGGLSLNIFTREELDEIHFATLEVLEHTGLLIDDDEALELFHGAGARVDKEKRIVKMPPYVVEDAIRSAPSRAKDTAVVAGPSGTVWTGEVAADSCTDQAGSVSSPSMWLIRHFNRVARSSSHRSKPLSC